MQAVIEKTKLNPIEVGDIVVGTVLAPGSIRASECRMAAFCAGFPGIIYNIQLFSAFVFHRNSFNFSHKFWPKLGVFSI